MKNILFTHDYFLHFDPKQWSIGLPYPPLGTLYAAALLRENGYNVSVFDVMFAKHPDELIPEMDKAQPAVVVIYDDGFNYLTKMCLTNMREAAFRMIALAKQRNCIVIMSGSDSTDHNEEYLAKGADFILIGEGEITLSELILALEDDDPNLSVIPGIAYKKDQSIIKNQSRQVLRDLDSLPFPAYDLIDIKPYKDSWIKNAGYFSLNMTTTRGCPFKCNWCAKPIYGNRYNVRSPQNVVEELKLLKQQYGFDHIWFCDDIFGLKPGWVKEFADILTREKVSLRFKIQARADLLQEEELVKALAVAGCDNAWIGAESGSQKILDAMDKGTNVQQITNATVLLKKYGIKPSFFIQFGYPGETKEDISMTINMINRLLPHEIGISVSYPLPGTLFYEKVKNQLQTKSNWSDSDEMALMFRNTYQPQFYKKLHSYVHKNYRKHIAFENIKKISAHPFTLGRSNLRKALSAIYYIPATFLDKIKLNKLGKAI